MNHWYVSGAVPVAVTENVADCPAVTVRLAGCTVIEGATGAGAFTVSIAVLLVALPAELLTFTLIDAPLCPTVVCAIENVFAFVPTAALFIDHWYVSGDVPVAVTENDADCPAVTVTLAGC
jgi:hypothetical protein